MWFWLLTVAAVFSFVAAVHYGPPLLRGLALRWRLDRLAKTLTSNDSTSDAKRLVAKAYLRSATVFVWFDGFAPGVNLPETKREPGVLLVFGEAFPGIPQDVRCDELGIGATLMFDSEPASAWVPWQAVFAMGSGPRDARWSWVEQLEPASRERLSLKFYERRLRCPGCACPPLGERWVCAACGAKMNPFQNAGRCQKCQHSCSDVACRRCQERFALDTWQVDEANPEEAAG